MRPLRALNLFAAFLGACALQCGVARAQSPSGQASNVSSPAAASTRSHVERFSAPEDRAGRDEAEANAKLAANPDDASALNTRALARMRLGRHAEAHADLRRAVTLAPSNADYHAGLGYALWKLSRPAEAVNALRTALKLDEKNFTARYQLGRFLLRLGEPALVKESVVHLRRALELDARQIETRFELIAAYRELNDPEQATAQLKIIQDARPSDPRVSYVAGLLASDRGDMPAAVEGFRAALRRDPTLAGAWQDLGVAYVKLARWPEAVETFNELTKRQNDSSDAAYFHALALHNAARGEESEREVRRALRLNAGASAAHALLGIILFTRSGASVEARDALAQATALDPSDFDAHYYLGRVQGDIKDYVGSVKSLGAAVRLEPRHQFARFLYGYALELTGEFEAAMKEYEELVKQNPDSAYGQLGLGALLVKQGKSDEAVAALRRSIALDASIFESHWSLGRALAIAKRYPEAIEAFRAAVALAPGRPDGHYQLGLALQRTGQPDEAKRAFDEAARITTAFRTGGATTTEP